MNCSVNMVAHFRVYRLDEYKMRNRLPFILCTVVSAVVSLLNIAVMILARFFPAHLDWNFMDKSLGFALMWIFVGLVMNIIATIIGRKDRQRIYMIASWLLFGVALITTVFNPVYLSV